MKVYIIYSGNASKMIAEALRVALSAIIQSNQYFLAHYDIPPGKDWRSYIQAELETSLFGIACMTSENIDNTWMHFEAGAMSTKAGVIPYLTGIESNMLHSTIQNLQNLVADKNGTKHLAKMINSYSNPSLETETLEASFEGQWPLLDLKITKALEQLTKPDLNKSIPIHSDESPHYVSDSTYSGYDKLGDDLKQVQDKLKADMISAWLPEPRLNPKLLRLVHSSDHNWEELRGLKLDIYPPNSERQGIAVKVFKSNDINVSNSPAEDSDSKTAFFEYSSSKIRNMITMPLRVGGKPVGICQISRLSAEAFTKEEVSTAMKHSSHLGQLILALSENDSGLIRDLADGIDTVYVTAIFSDINSYTKFAYTTEPENAMQFLNDYYCRMYTAITSKGGELREYTGDGVYAAFTGSTALATIPPAIEAACNMRDAFSVLRTKWKNFNYKIDEKENTHRMGICCGKVTRAFLGHPKKRQIQLVGEPINTAYQLCHKTGVGQGEVILTNMATRELIEITGQCSVNDFQPEKGIFKVQLPTSADHDCSRVIVDSSVRELKRIGIYG